MRDDGRPEWKEGWPRGTWVKTIDGLVFEVFQMAIGPDNGPMYLVRPPVELPGTRYIAIWTVLIVEARTADGSVYTRDI